MTAQPASRYRIDFADGIRRHVTVNSVRRDGTDLVAEVHLEGDPGPLTVRLRRAGPGLCALDLAAADGSVVSAGPIGLESAPGTSEVRVLVCGESHRLVCRESSLAEVLDRYAQAETTGDVQESLVTSPIPGRVAAIEVRVGDRVRPDQSLVVIEAMKMENEIAAGHEGIVAEVLVEPDQTVESGQALIRLA